MYFSQCPKCGFLSAAFGSSPTIRDLRAVFPLHGHINIIKTIRFRSAFLVDEGYIYELDKDGYSILKGYSLD